MDFVQDSDWSHFVAIREKAYERYCSQALSEIVNCAFDSSRSSPDRYQAVYEKMHAFDRGLLSTFENTNRARMVMQLVVIHSLQLVDEDDLNGFSIGVRERVMSLVAIST